MASLVTPHLDYGNGLLIGAVDMLIRKYQGIQNMAAKLILNRLKTDSATSVHYELHWLPILVLVFKCLNNMAPKILRESLMYQ